MTNPPINHELTQHHDLFSDALLSDASPFDDFVESFDSGLYIGMMSGTSLDALDVVLCRFGEEADGNVAQLIASHSQPFEPNLRAVLLALCQPNAVDELSFSVSQNLGFSHKNSPKGELDWLGWASVAYAEFASDVVQTLLENSQTDANAVLAIGCHGQTVRHRPQWRFSWQLLDANVLTERTGISVVSDFRRRDMAVGGQGAPLAPAFHVAQFASVDTNRIVVNLGGIANITVLPANQPSQVIGFDTGPASNLLDAWYQHQVELGGVPKAFIKTKLYDADGRWARSGTVHPPLLTRLLTHPFFAQSAPKSTGREAFNLTWLEQQIEAVDNRISPADVQATLTALTVQSLALAIVHEARKSDMNTDMRGEVIVCGGGAYNTHLLTKLADALPKWHIKTSQEFGIAPTWIEAMAFAWLARQTLLGRAGNLPVVTGASQAVVLGQVCFA